MKDLRQAIQDILPILQQGNVPRDQILKFRDNYYPELKISKGTVSKILNPKRHPDGTDETIETLYSIIILYLAQNINELEKIGVLKTLNQRLELDRSTIISESEQIVKSLESKRKIRVDLFKLDPLLGLVEGKPIIFRILLFTIIYQVTPIVFSLYYGTFHGIKYSYITSEVSTLGYALFSVGSVIFIYKFYQLAQSYLYNANCQFSPKFELTKSFKILNLKINRYSVIIGGFAFIISGVLHALFILDEYHGYLETAIGIPGFLWFFDLIFFSYQIYILLRVIMIQYQLLRFQRKLKMVIGNRKPSDSLTQIFQELVTNSYSIFSFFLLYMLITAHNFLSFDLSEGVPLLNWQAFEILLITLPSFMFLLFTVQFKKEAILSFE